jgi:hemolysin III
MRRLDHSMIFVVIAGTYTPFALIALEGALAGAILIAVWAGAAAGIMLKPGRSSMPASADPVPAVFGYHEVFHVLVIAAAGLQYAAIAFFVLPDARS